MKTVTRLAATLLLLVLTLTACGEEPIGLIAAYTGEEVTTTDHVFTTDDFYVIASFENSADKTLSSKDFTIEQEGMDHGYFIIKVKYKGYEDYTYVHCAVPVYPSDKK